MVIKADEMTPVAGAAEEQQQQPGQSPNKEPERSTAHQDPQISFHAISPGKSTFHLVVLSILGADWSGERSPLLGHKSPPQSPAKVWIPEAPWHPVLYPDIILSGAQHECLRSEEADREASSGNTGEKTDTASVDSCQVLSVASLLQPPPRGLVPRPSFRPTLRKS
ncbi:hypothetical protein lerEdw1_001808 [Lerista edwardsae]|nr:hypothetical protein lerEdw1_001808 [Lerista edwardsae]